jgi:hypothetical protein
LMLVLKDSPPNSRSMLPQFCCGETVSQVEAHSDSVQPAGYRDGGVDWNCVVFVVLVEVQKGQKTPLVACAVLEHQSQVRQLPSRASLTDLFRAGRASDWLQASVLTKATSIQILMP